MNHAPREIERAVHLAAKLLKCLANSQRLLILCHLAEGERAVAELEQRLGIEQPRLSQQLARLRRDGLVKTRRNSRSIYYALASEHTSRVIDLLYELYCRKGVSAPSPRRVRGAPKARPWAS